MGASKILSWKYGGWRLACIVGVVAGGWKINFERKKSRIYFESPKQERERFHSDYILHNNFQNAYVDLYDKKKWGNQSDAISNCNYSDSSSKEFDSVELEFHRGCEKFSQTLIKCKKLMSDFMLVHGIPGMVLRISVDGEVIDIPMGLSDVENGACCSEDTVMRIASISKPLTAVALLKLWQEGKVDLDKPIQKYIPYFPIKKYKGIPVTITTRQLLSHMAGIQHYSKFPSVEKLSDKESSKGKMENKKGEFDHEEYYTLKHYDSVSESLNIFKDDDLISEPGMEFNYTTHGWTLVSAVIENASGKDFLTYMEQNIFFPLGMSSTVPEMNAPLIPHRGRFYKRDGKGHLYNTPYIDNSYKWAGGGFLSTTKDLIKFGNALLLSFNQHQKREQTVCHRRRELGETERIDQNCSESRKERGTQREVDGFEIDAVNSGTDQIKNDRKNIDELEHTSSNVSSGSTQLQIIKKDSSSMNYILNPSTVEMMWRPVIKTKKKLDICYGMGWGVIPMKEKVAGGRKTPFIAFHGGGAVGASSSLIIIPGPNPSNSERFSSGETIKMADFKGRYSHGKCHLGDNEMENVQMDPNRCTKCTHQPRGIVVAALANLQGVSVISELGVRIAMQIYETVYDDED